MKNVADRVMADYREMPGLCVTVAQGARLWGLSFIECEQVLAMLVADGHLYHDDNGLYVRRGALARRRRTAKAPLARAADWSTRVSKTPR
jgi:hypothetical protein